MKNCDYCGYKAADDADTCPRCATPFQVDDDSEPLVDEEASSWILNAYLWALQQFGVERFYQQTILVTPTREHFPDGSKDPGERALEIFNRVRAYCGMQTWPCKLFAQAPDLNPRLAPLIAIHNAPRGPGGTFCRPCGSDVEITYNPDLVNRSQALVAVFAHELAHYLGRHAAARRGKELGICDRPVGRFHGLRHLPGQFRYPVRAILRDRFTRLVVRDAWLSDRI